MWVATWVAMVNTPVIPEQKRIPTSNPPQPLLLSDHDHERGGTRGEWTQWQTSTFLGLCSKNCDPDAVVRSVDAW